MSDSTVNPSTVSPLPPLSQNKAYIQFQAARLSWTLAVQVLGVAIAWQVFDATKKPLSLGFVGLAQFLPMFALSLVTGKAADTFDRRKIMIACYSLSALAAAILLVANLTGNAKMPLVYVTLVLLGISRAFGSPAGQSLGATLVPKEQLAAAIAWASSGWQLALICGPTAGGVLVAVGRGPNFAYGTTLGVLFVATMLLVLLRTTPKQKPPAKERGMDALFAGVRYVADTRIILGAISLDLFAVLLGGAVALLPFFAGALDVGPWGYGMLRSAPAVGAALVAALVGRFPIKSGAGLKMFACVLAFGVATIVFGVSKSFVLSLVALFITGAADMVSVVVRMTLVQMMTPDEMRGRVSAVNNVFIGASNELGEFESGVTAEWLTPRIATIVGGVGTCVIVGVWMLLFPELRKIDRLDGGSS
jgi:MFS family permease